MPSNRLFGFAIAAAVFILDQLVKAWVVGPMAISMQGDARQILSFFDLRFVPNVGISLGLLPADGPLMRWALVLLTAAIAVGVGVWMWRETVRGDLVALALVLGGAIGNILDRVRLGYVVDYADLHFGEWRPFLVFNVADAAITIGVVILLVRSLFAKKPVKAGVSGEASNA